MGNVELVQIMLNLIIKPILAIVLITSDTMPKATNVSQWTTAQIPSNGMVSDADAPITISHGIIDVEHAHQTHVLVKIKQHAIVTIIGNLMVLTIDVLTHVDQIKLHQVTAAFVLIISIDITMVHVKHAHQVAEPIQHKQHVSVIDLIKHLIKLTINVWLRTIVVQIK